MTTEFQEYPKWVTHRRTGEQKIVYDLEEEGLFLSFKGPKEAPPQDGTPEPDQTNAGSEG